MTHPDRDYDGCCEFFVCPSCGEASYDYYAIKPPEGEYTCRTRCKHCRTRIKTVDTIKRCVKCDEKLDCLIDGMPVDLSAMALGRLNQLDCESICSLIELNL